MWQRMHSPPCHCNHHQSSYFLTAPVISYYACGSLFPSISRVSCLTFFPCLECSCHNHNSCNIACGVHHVCEKSWEEQQRHQEWLGNVVLPTASKQNGDQIESAEQHHPLQQQKQKQHVFFVLEPLLLLEIPFCCQMFGLQTHGPNLEDQLAIGHRSYSSSLNPQTLQPLKSHHHAPPARA